MEKWLILADDLTGSLDTGVQFARLGIETRVLIDPQEDPFRDETAEVFVVDTESRHIVPSEAEKRVCRTVRSARRAGITHFYKKTDSGLRGNIGAELQGLLDAFTQEESAMGETEKKEPEISFIPAYPAMHRIVRAGISYIDGVPVAESSFGRDPFDPVRESEVAGILRMSGLRHPKQVHVLDAETDADLEALYRRLEQQNALLLTAGCAGFARVLAEHRFPGRALHNPCPHGPFLIVCGSLHPMARLQTAQAAENGAAITRFSAQELLAQEASCTFRQKRDALQEAVLRGENRQIETQAPDPSDQSQTAGILRSTIAEALAGLVRSVTVPASTLVVIGGDTLYALFREFSVTGIRMEGEPEPGTVCFTAESEKGPLSVISKAGGFGGPQWLARLMQPDADKDRSIQSE